jgi:hypothetical protein
MIASKLLIPQRPQWFQDSIKMEINAQLILLLIQQIPTTNVLQVQQETLSTRHLKNVRKIAIQQ